MNSGETSLIEVWEWNGKAFEFKRHLSTTCPISEMDTGKRFYDKIEKLMKINKNSNK